MIAEREMGSEGEGHPTLMRLTLTLMAFVISSCVHAPFTRGGHLVWLRDESQAFAQAQAMHRPVIVDFYADWCSSCSQLDDETYSDPRVRDLIAARFVPLKVDCTDGDNHATQAIQKKYGVSILPTVLFLDTSGKPIAAPVTEFIGPNPFLQVLAQIP